MHHQGPNSSASYLPSSLWERDKGENRLKTKLLVSITNKEFAP